MGYHRPMSFFNIEKKGEFNERKYFDIDMAIKKATEGGTK
jgi:hypothetical protein